MIININVPHKLTGLHLANYHDIVVEQMILGFFVDAAFKKDEVNSHGLYVLDEVCGLLLSVLNHVLKGDKCCCCSHSRQVFCLDVTVDQHHLETLEVQWHLLRRITLLDHRPHQISS